MHSIAGAKEHCWQLIVHCCVAQDHPEKCGQALCMPIQESVST